MTRKEVEQLPRAEYFDGHICPVCKGPMIAYSGRMETIEEHKRVLGDELMGSDYLLLHHIGSLCPKARFVAGVPDQCYLDEVERSDFVILAGDTE